jgi:hypothetical protein
MVGKRVAALGQRFERGTDFVIVEFALFPRRHVAVRDIHEDFAVHLRHVQIRKCADVVAAERMPHKKIRPRNVGVVQGRVQLLRDLDAGTRHRPGFAETVAGAVVDAGSRVACNHGLDQDPRR